MDKMKKQQPAKTEHSRGGYMSAAGTRVEQLEASIWEINVEKKKTN